MTDKEKIATPALSGSLVESRAMYDESLNAKAERAFRRARERREEQIRAELREKIATGVEGDDFWLRSSEGPKLMRDLAARIRKGALG